MKNGKIAFRVVFVAVAILVCCIGSLKYRRLCVAQADYRRLCSLTGELVIKDPDKAAIIKMPLDSANPNLDRWRVYLPLGKKFSLQQLHLQSHRRYPNYSISGSGIVDSLEGENVTIGYGSLGSEVEFNRISFARRGLHGGTILSKTGPPSEFSFDPKTDTVVWPDAHSLSSISCDDPICLMAVYRKPDGKTNQRDILTFAFFISPGIGFDDFTKLIPFAIKPSTDLEKGSQ